MLTIFVWPDGTFCEKDELEHFADMSDDYKMVTLSEEEADALYRGDLDPENLLYYD